MGRELNLLTVCNREENKRTLLQIIGNLPINVYTTSFIKEAQEVLSGRAIDVIFCDESLPDGTYRELLLGVRSEHGVARFVVFLSSGGWEEQLEAMRLGASDAMRRPYQAADVDIILIREAARCGKESSG